MKRGNKYRAQSMICANGHVHQSKKEARHCDLLFMLERAGEIADLRQQPHYPFVIHGIPLKGKNGHKLGFTADFEYREGDELIACEVKGFVVRDYPLRSALFRALYPSIRLKEV